VAPRFLENLCTPGVKYKIQNTDFLFQNIFTVSSSDYTASTWAMINKKWTDWERLWKEGVTTWFEIIA